MKWLPPGREWHLTLQCKTYLAEFKSEVALSFVYDGNGKRLIQSVVQQGSKGSTTTTKTLYAGSLYEEEISSTNQNKPYISYYFIGSKMVGLRRGNQADPTTDGQYRIVGTTWAQPLW